MHFSTHALRRGTGRLTFFGPGPHVSAIFKARIENTMVCDTRISDETIETAPFEWELPRLSPVGIFMQVVLFSPGSFQSTAGQAWQDLHQLGPGIFRTQQDHGIHEPLQKRAKDISRRGFARGRTQEFAGGPQIEKFK
jgi:hypothetical protein